MKKIIFLSCFLLVVSQSFSIVASYNVETESSRIDAEIVDMLEEVNESILYHYLENLVEIGPRFTGSENCKKAAEYINDEFKNMGLDSFIQSWTYLRRKCQNVVATLNGSDSESDAVIILSAHYDTVKNTPGANDDGSGVAAIL